MNKPRIYIHHTWQYPLYMTAENQARLEAFADVSGGGEWIAPADPGLLVERLRGVEGILSLNGIGADEITTDVLRAAGTVRVAAISHWFFFLHDKARPIWQAAGVEVIDASDACTEAVAEWTVAAILTGSRRLPEFDRALKSGDPWAEPRLDGKMLCESTVGLVGLGRIGRTVGAQLRVFGPRILAFDALCSEDDAQALGVELVSLENLLRRSDVVSLHLPVTEETRGLLGRRELAWIRDGALLVNSARSVLVDGEALLAELRSSRLRAFLDVFDTEPLPADDPLRSLENVFLTPHIAGYNRDMFVRCGRTAIDRLQEYFAASAG